MITKEQIVLAQNEQKATELFQRLLTSVNLNNLVQAETGEADPELVYTLHTVRNQVLTVLTRGILHTCYGALYGPLPPVKDGDTYDAYDMIRDYKPPVAQDEEELTLGDFIPEEA